MAMRRARHKRQDDGGGIEQQVVHHINMLWWERLWMLVDVFQIYAIIWSMSLTYPWPRAWLHWTRFTVWTNLDVLNGISRFTPVGKSNLNRNPGGAWEGYFFYAFALSVLPLLVGIGLAFFVRTEQCSRR